MRWMQKIDIYAHVYMEMHVWELLLGIGSVYFRGNLQMYAKITCCNARRASELVKTLMQNFRH